MYKTGNQQAFTLTELLVIIAIIAVLSAFLYPTIASSKASAKDSLCIQNLRQIGGAMQMYLSDHDDTYPRAVSSRSEGDGTDQTSSIVWELLRPYGVRNAQLRCPHDTVSPIELPGKGSHFEAYGSSYYYAFSTGSPLLTNRDPSSTILVRDGFRYHSNGGSPRFGAVMMDGHSRIELWSKVDELSADTQ
jgi:prepilin-type N-terminal cleavage/methylation domain-containing protein